ncbi:MAG TPA: hypothetical protein VFS25_06670 [Chitinophaga sp.]|uniref:hypothetical protein n=1 Tax=Chitinophaga sp. TaxID=1869181 RepID=UPI002DBA2E0A|nr:hypothetical protein [Chitinophaga sp.]HEU4552496.1 hypothetical protein [Chitinophaga sp.]
MKNKQNQPPKKDLPPQPDMKEQEEKREKTFPGYPTYPASEDIMNQGKQEDLDVENITRNVQLNNELKKRKKEDEEPDEERKLDIPGAELDNDGENIGEEDEENNFYSLGGDRHENLEDDPTATEEDDQS